MSLENVEDAFALSPMQSGMLFDSLAAPERDVYVTYVTFDIAGDINIDLLRSAWHAVIARHQALRAEFHWDGLDSPLQVITKEFVLPWQVVDWSNHSEEKHASLMNELLGAERQIKIELSSAPLCRITFIKRTPANSSLLWSVHHLLADGSSTPVILKEVMGQYKAMVDSKAVEEDLLPYQYSEFIQWISQQDMRAAVDYWQNYLKGADPSPVKLRQLKPGLREVAPKNITPSISKILTTELSTELSEYCRQSTISLSTFFHGLWALLLREYSGSTSVLFASTVSGRNSDVGGMNEAVGMYLNAQPRLIETDGTEKLASWLQEIQRDIHRSAEFDYLSLGEVLKLFEYEPGVEPVDSILTIGAHPKSLEIAGSDVGVRFSNIHYQVARSHYSLALIVTPGDSLELSVVYHEDKYHSEDIHGMLSYLENLLTDLLHASDLALPSEICARIASQAPKSPAVSSESREIFSSNTVHGQFESIVDKQPNDIAIRFNNDAVSYLTLDRAANKIAHLLTQTNKTPCQSPIGLMLPRGTEQIAGMLGILKTSSAYTPIDTEYPVAKLRQLLQSSSIEYVVTTKAYASIVESCGAVVFLCDDALQCSEERIEAAKISDQSLAYVMHTSGSTGQPKGVRITHANLLYSTLTRIKYYKEPSPTYLLLSAIVFDSSVAGIYWCLCGGGTLVLPKPDEEKDIDSIVEILRAEKISHTLCLPSYYSLLLNHTEERLPKTLEVVIVAGEACPAQLVNRHFVDHADIKLFNEYGPTEACVWSSVREFSAPLIGAVTIGKAIGTTYLQVLNDHGNICPPGVEGEIVIGGKGVSPGYLNDEAQTNQNFVPNPVAVLGVPVVYKTGDRGFFNDENELVFNGRIDRQLKIRGYRIEPSEIEEVLNHHEGVAQSVVVALNRSMLNEVRSRASSVDTNAKEPEDRKVLVAYYVLSQQPKTIDSAHVASKAVAVHELQNALDESVLLGFCRERLAAQICPIRFVALNKLPLLANGKVAHANLPTPARQATREIFDAPAVLARAQQLVNILEELLEIEDITPGDNFFAIGGDSITAIQFISRARKCGLPIDVASVSQSSTISEIAANCKSIEPPSAQENPYTQETDKQQNFAASGLNKDDLDDFLDSFDD